MTLIACLGVGLALSLWACAWLTPRGWWRRPNLRALGALSLGTAAIAAALYAVVHDPAAPPQMAVSDTPKAGTRYRVHDALNLRVDAGVNARRLAVVPAGSRLVATGRHDGDWWQVRAVVGGREVEGWASSLWLRRGDEGPVQASSGDARRIGL